MPFFDSTFKEILSSQAASVADGLIARTLLAFYTDKMLLLPGMLILIPGFLEMRGNISGSFSSRIACGLFLGVVKPEKIWTKIVKGNLSRLSCRQSLCRFRFAFWHSFLLMFFLAFPLRA